MTTYQMHTIHEFNYPVGPLPQQVRYKIGDRIPINSGGNTVAMGQVIEAGPDGYKVRIINTYGNRRGPSEVK